MNTKEKSRLNDNDSNNKIKIINSMIVKKEQKGITLVALVVTIVIMLILAGVTLNVALGENGLFKMSKDAVKKYEDAQKYEEETLKELEREMNNLDGEVNIKKGVNRPKLSEGMIPIKYKEGKWLITNEYDEEWYDYKDIDPDKGTNNLAWANVMLSDGTYKASNKDKSKADGGYTDDGTIEVKENELGSMFVWIPRFAYSITKYHTDVASGEGTTQKIFDVSFIKGTGSTDFEDNKYGYSYDAVKAVAGQATQKIVHSAFSFGGNNLSGIWVAKFEASMQESNANTTTNNNVTTKTVKILPNAETWRYINIGNCFINCLNMNKTDNIYGLSQGKTDSHLIKNTEWGAVVYLAASQYGVVPIINNKVSQDTQDTSVYHEWAGGQNYVANVKQSTTGNITGIYDMCGGAWEYVAGYYDNENTILKTNGTEAFETNGKLKTEYTKYWNKYEVGEEEKTTYKVSSSLWDKYDANLNSTRIELTKEKYKLMGSYIGDAGYEIIKDNNYSYYGITSSNSYAWILISHENASGTEYGTGYYNGDLALIGHCALPFVLRGGRWGNGSGAGVFAWNGSDGSPYYGYGFRPVLV